MSSISRYNSDKYQITPTLGTQSCTRRRSAPTKRWTPSSSLNTGSTARRATARIIPILSAITTTIHSSLKGRVFNKRIPICTSELATPPCCRRGTLCSKLWMMRYLGRQEMPESVWIRGMVRLSESEMAPWRKARTKLIRKRTGQGEEQLGGQWLEVGSKRLMDRCRRSMRPNVGW